MAATYDFAVIGGGIVGLATAYRLTRRVPDARVVLLEKEAGLSRHQTGRNSGVIHSGIYYRPGSLKARTCRAGKAALEAFCDEHGVAFDRCGKVVVATDEQESDRLDTLLERGRANGVDCEPIDAKRLREIEPHAAGLRALHVRETGIVDYAAVCGRLAELIRAAGGDLVLGARVAAISRVAGGDAVTLGTTNGTYQAGRVVSCGGLQSDRLARLDGVGGGVRIVPFRGEYFTLRPAARRLVKNLIYPVPDPAFPFLGVHFTRMIAGGVECGPNAVPALSREGYAKFAFDAREAAGMVAHGGLLRLAGRHWRMGLGELWRSASRAAFVRALRRLVPEVTTDDLVPAPAGHRAQAMKPDGTLIDDFVIEHAGAVTHVLNATSPAATASLAIADEIVDACLGSPAGHTMA
ncbi:MAG: L-2-hydroxyglutarate oxidase [Planctomycetota bacterium]